MPSSRLERPDWFTGPWPWDWSPDGPGLDWWDVVVIAVSGGKDSQAMTLFLSEQPGFDPGRMWVVHNDTGLEHRGAFEKVQEVASSVGVPEEHVLKVEPYLRRTLLDVVLMRRRWPGMTPTSRPCTNTLKRDPTDKVLRRLGDNARILLLTGERREESRERVRMDPWAFRRATSAAKQRLVVQWRPLLDWPVADVFGQIARHGQRPLWVYDAGAVTSQLGDLHLDGASLAFGRASCAFCIYLRPAELEISFNLYPALACLATKVERYIGHTWRKDLALADVWARVYGPGGYRAEEGKRLLALSPEELIQEALRRSLDEIAPEVLSDLLAAAGTVI